MNTVFPSEEFGIEMQRSMSGFFSRFLLCLFPIFCVGVYKGFSVGFYQSDYLLLALGAPISYILAFAYGLVGILEAYGKPRKLWMYPAVWLGFVPYLFVVYLTFYRGVWSLVSLIWNFSWMALIAALIFTLIGFLAIRPLHMITEFCRRIALAIKNQ